MKYADLHIHSSYSDGYLSPEGIIDLAKKQGIKCISITDHDTIASQYVTKNKIDGISIIPGIELSTEYKEMELHILGYFVDIENNKLNETVDRLRRSRIDRTKEILNRLQKINININMEDLNIGESASIGRGNIANAIVKKGYADNYKDAFTNYLMKGKVAYVKGEKLSLRETLDIINESGGISVLAHPGKIYRSLGIESIIKEFKCYGLKGIEVYHPSHTKEQINTFYNLSKKYKLLITGGSDFHGASNAILSLASQGIDKVLLEKIINYKGKL